jgi:hypothetical protein
MEKFTIWNGQEYIGEGTLYDKGNGSLRKNYWLILVADGYYQGDLAVCLGLPNGNEIEASGIITVKDYTRINNK